MGFESITYCSIVFDFAYLHVETDPIDRIRNRPPRRFVVRSGSYKSECLVLYKSV